MEHDLESVPVQDKTDLCTEYQQLVVLFALTSSFAAQSRDLDLCFSPTEHVGAVALQL